ncbi:MAG: ABC transporter ATP-binding protein [Clostridiales bacterium]|nr:ABC transporter ATP-binding protein [Clostridiales bacterium]
MQRNVIEIENLSKAFKTVQAVDNLSFKVKEGELFAFLGVNGAGKSTTIHVLCGSLKKDSGTVKVYDKDSADKTVLNRMGVVFQNSVLDKSLTVKDNLVFRGALYGLFGEEIEKRITHLASLLDFSDLLNRTVGKLSGGQRRRVDIARALLHKPGILILDEPTTGLDPQTRKLLWDVLANLRKQENLTVFLTTHYMEEAAEADYIVILDAGKIAAEGTPLSLKNAHTGDSVSLYGVSEGEVTSLGAPYEKIAGGYRVSLPNTGEATQLILQHPEVFRDYEITKGNMDDVFLAVTGKRLTGGKEQ